MTKHTSPFEWQVPIWHEDFGDPRSDFDALCSLAIKLCDSRPGVKTELETPEPGLMELRVELPNGIVAEVHSVVVAGQKHERRFAVFVSPDIQNESEHYFDSVANASQSLWSCLEFRMIEK